MLSLLFSSMFIFSSSQHAIAAATCDLSAMNLRSTPDIPATADENAQFQVKITMEFPADEGTFCESGGIIFKFKYTASTGDSTGNSKTGSPIKDNGVLVGFRTADNAISWADITNGAAVDSNSSISVEISAVSEDRTAPQVVGEDRISITSTTQGAGGNPTNSPPDNSTGGGAPANTNAGSGLIGQGLGSIKSLFPGPLSASQNVVDFITNLIKMLLAIVLAVAVLFIILGGFWYITSAGNETQAEKGKNTLKYALFGIVIIVLSYVLVTIVTNFLLGNTGP